MTAGERNPGQLLNIPNLITIGRIFLVPVIVWLLVSRRLEAAFFLFLLAGISDAVDGYIAKRFGWQTELGAYMDPLADKLLLVTVFVVLGALGDLPSWLVIAVVSRDVLIVIAFLFAWGVGHPLRVKPYRISKVNTAAQIALAAVVLADGAFGLGLAGVRVALAWLTLALTLGSLGAYLVAWLRHMAQFEER